MDKYKEATKDIPWASLGRETVASRLGRSLLPVGVVNYEAQLFDPTKPQPVVTNEDPEFERYLMEIAGTAIQAGEGKLVTCAHVITGVNSTGRKGYVLARAFRGNTVIYNKWPLAGALRYIDPRANAVNKDVDLAVIVGAPKSTPDFPYEVPAVKWGDAGKLGVGDPVMLGGYPYGTALFRFRDANRGIIQPSFYSGIVSAILPAAKPGETRVLQIDASVAGGMSGGAVFNPGNGEVVGMVIQGLQGKGGDLHPVTYALPSEIIAPFARAISFATEDGRRVGVSD